MRNQYLTEGMEEMLRQIQDSEEHEIIQATPGGWWIDSEEVDSRIAFALLRLCLLRQEPTNDPSFIRYTVNQEGRNVLNDPEYVPQIVSELKQRRPKRWVQT